MKKILYVFACALLICACDKSSLEPDNESIPQSPNNSEQTTESQSKSAQTIIVKSDQGDEWTFSYGNDGRILQYSDTDLHYCYSYAGYMITEQLEYYGANGKCNSMPFIDGHIDRWIEPRANSCIEHNYKYDGDFLILEERLYGDEARYYSYIWGDTCLSKISEQYNDGTVEYEYQFTYGKDSNPYYDLNFDPTAIWLWPGYESRWKVAGLLGKSSKKLPTSVKVVGEEENDYTISIDYKFSSGSLSEMTVFDNNSTTVYSFSSK